MNIAVKNIAKNAQPMKNGKNIARKDAPKKQKTMKKYTGIIKEKRAANPSLERIAPEESET